MKTFQSKVYKSIQSAWSIAVLCLINTFILYGASGTPDSLIYDVAQLGNEPVFLYQYLKIHEQEEGSHSTHFDSCLLYTSDAADE